jgi:hypothetical protein
MQARLLYREIYIYADGAIREMVLWQLPGKFTDERYGLKYRLYYGLANGTCLVRYDNETGKGDHRHFLDKDLPYRFKNVETLVADFFSDIEYARSAGNEKAD